ncbi:MAG: DUF11 domain-containing protein [Gloeocapsa sp. UFS-A4-WI-NPMV-4B04]|jgi:uncharacterized repeat protein (TIGR01451 family)|nr:DUF11 domain-containing protein [Gloeocapsa sp. UFS-A4-WI-NPMV-4B04]
MKRIAIGILAVIATAPFVSQPVLALREAGTVVAQNTQSQPKVALRLGAEKKIVRKNPQGKPQVGWQTLQGNVVVQPGDTLRYVVTGKNNSNAAVRNFVVTQPIPKQTTYVLNSVTAKNKAKVTYSINNGKTFVEKPTVQVKLANGKVQTRPAPAEAYTHVRWKFEQPIAPTAVVNGTYQVRVR